MMNKPDTTKGFVAAFTILEIMVALVITGIVATMATWAFSNINQFVQVHRANENQNLDFARFISYMHSDINASVEIAYKNQELIFNLPNDEVAYQFFDDAIVRSNRVMDDTIFIATKQLGFSTLGDYPDVIESVNITLQMGKVQYPMTFTKFYSNQQLFQFAYANSD